MEILEACKMNVLAEFLIKQIMEEKKLKNKTFKNVIYFSNS